MSDLSEEKLLHLNKIGLIPGPGEEIEAFSKRVDYSLNLKDSLPEELLANLSGDELQKSDVLSQSCNHLKKLYDCAPDWTPLFFSNYKLPFWHGGCAWIFQIAEDSPTSALIQLRRTFRHSPKYLGIYNREELLTHELSHVGRMMFQEPKFEELLAYQTSNSAFRRWLGPLVQSSTESALFLLFLFMLIVFDVFLIASNRPDAYLMALWLKIIPVAFIALALVRLWKKQKTYAECINKLSECVGPDKAKAVAFRLQDNEIVRFAKMKPAEIKEYAADRMKDELRWQVIYKAYF
ncbi:MAG TPA: hypothetical protein VGP47_07410 [Parachlamydiaceae bacterium]|nr:hypothetical protein [Parachlamydiaceae bacterium]